jgi:hypothetical protein
METLIEFLQSYILSNPEGNHSQIVLEIYFIAQSFPDIQRQFQKLAIDTESTTSQLVENDFKVFNIRNVAEEEKERDEKAVPY